MKVFFSLIVFSLILVTCQACYVVDFEDQDSRGKHIPPHTCIDLYDNKTHLIGSTWVAEDCYNCVCKKHRMFCCHRKVEEIAGCKWVLNDVTCAYEYYRLDDPTQRCNV